MNKDFVVTRDYRIRKLTPRECFRLMGFFDDEIDLVGLSDTQKYKLAGNGQDVNLVSLLFRNMGLLYVDNVKGLKNE
jgi:DNA (cytosine-5)-methyltransferase 1